VSFVASQRVFIVVIVYFVMTQSGNFWIHPRTSSWRGPRGCEHDGEEKNSYTCRESNPVVQPIASKFSDLATLVPIITIIIILFALL